MDRKYQIFVSSTYDDLKDERNEVIKACLNMGHIPVGMEMFNAADEEQWAVIKRTIDQCDYYVVIVAHRYGSTTPEGISFTEMEYDYAREQGIPVLGFVIDASAAWPGDRMDKEPQAVKALQAFRSKVKQKMVSFWRNRSELRALFNESINKTANLQPRRGWVRAPEENDSPIGETLAKVAEENLRLRAALTEQNKQHERSDEIHDICAILENEQFQAKFLDDPYVASGAELFIHLLNELPEEFEKLESELEEWYEIAPWVRRPFIMKLHLLGLFDRQLDVFTATPLAKKVFARLQLRKLRTGR